MEIIMRSPDLPFGSLWGEQLRARPVASYQRPTSPRPSLHSPQIHVENRNQRHAHAAKPLAILFTPRRAGQSTVWTPIAAQSGILARQRWLKMFSAFAADMK